jgi:hypothetical protein
VNRDIPNSANGRTAWRLFNAFALPRRTQALHGLMDAACGLAYRTEDAEIQATDTHTHRGDAREHREEMRQFSVNPYRETKKSFSRLYGNSPVSSLSSL